MNIKQLAACALLAAATTVAHAQTDFPNQPIKIVVPAPAGGGTDLMARIVASAIATNTKWTVIVDNKPGASGIIGTEAVAKARPDGYTLSMGLTGTLGINPELFKTLPYDVTKDFVPIATVAEQPVVLVVRADSPYKTVADVVAAHKAKGGLTLASAGAGTVGQLVGEMFGRMVGTRFTNVPYKGSAPALQDVAGGVAEAMFATPPGALPLLQGGRLRALAVTSSKRLPLLPEVPTMAEAGFRNFQVSEWKLLVAPAGTPPAVVQRLNQEVQKALAQPTTIARVIADGSLPMTSSAPEAGRFLKAELTRWTGLVRESGLSKSN
ncbi:MAG TPA: tripartite tricarboxylate transporter substrate binding protein [Ramlibacter sp.]|nr:tripartite tricarboxylate transporter substrate binding protein [Ramlibacter sp.]